MSQSLYIPRLGDVLTLASAWSFSLYEEERNKKLFKELLPNVKVDWGALARRKWTYPRVLPAHHIVTLPAGTQLRVNRLYVRKGQDEFDSLSFYVERLGQEKAFEKNKPYFWAKLDDVNNKGLVIE